MTNFWGMQRNFLHKTESSILSCFITKKSVFGYNFFGTHSLKVVTFGKHNPYFITIDEIQKAVKF